ncbi:MAG: rod shape-determining protein MreC [Dehalococcoidia bacterium]|nr:rod shape-determining protein MreC [Dehalococcoidia bacterium]
MAVGRSIGWLILLACTGIGLLALSPLDAAGDMEERAAALVAPLTMAVRDASRPFADVLLSAGQMQQLTEENAELRQDLSRAQSELALLREQQTAVEQAAALVRAVGADADRYLPASVVLRDPAPGRRMLLLDRGAADGVMEGQPVLGGGATLVGVVAEVGEHRSRVRLVTDLSSAVTAVVQSSRTPGALAGTGDALTLEFVPVGSAVAAGDVVLTSALGGELPAGLLVGRVERVRTDAQALFEQIEVEPLADLARLEQVLVMTDFRPGASLEDPEATSGATATPQ